MHPSNDLFFSGIHPSIPTGETPWLWLFRRLRVVLRRIHRHMAQEHWSDGACPRLVGQCTSCGAKEFDRCRRPATDLAA